MLYRFRTSAKKAWFDFGTRRIAQTPPLRCDPASSLVILTQTIHRDLGMFLVAAKSFARYLRPKFFVIVDDGLEGNDHAVLRRHLSEVRFVPSREVDVGACPRGGMWERIHTIAKYSGDNYVIQLDADTLTLDRPTEVIEAVARNQTFTLGTTEGQRISSLEEAAAFARAHPNQNHMLIRAEAALGKYPGRESLKYVRGCAGFAGFARGQLNRAALEAFSTTMEGFVGNETWRQWGSEQVTSNFLIANAESPLVLPIDRYATFEGANSVQQAAFIHFLGTWRFRKGVYRRLSRRMIRQMLGG
ncbi:MAG: hypothetical protein IPK13_08905 [Deltaproteobacteria bacterium]|nr:hypothetical protein [Deltaproteobacteria bacterium]